MMENIQPNKTTLCIIPSSTLSPEENTNIIAERRSMKAMHASLCGIPIVTPLWIHDCLQQNKCIVPESNMYIRTLPTKTNIVSSNFGVAYLAATIHSTYRPQKSNRLNKQCYVPLQNAAIAYLVGFSSNDETNFSSLLRRSGVSEVVVNQQTALSKLKTFCSNAVAHSRNTCNTKTQLPPHQQQQQQQNRFVVICYDTKNNNLSWSEAFVRTVREFYAVVPPPTQQQRIMFVNVQWLFDSVSCGTLLECNATASIVNTANQSQQCYFYQPLDSKAKELWEITMDRSAVE
jgi:hypothetical protein